MSAPHALTPDEVITLDACSHHARQRRQRRRAQAVLGHHRGQTLNQLAAFFAVRYATVHGWLNAWCDHGLASLLEGKRAGRLPKLPPATKKSDRLVRQGYPVIAAPAPRLRRPAAPQHVAPDGAGRRLRLEALPAFLAGPARPGRVAACQARLQDLHRAQARGEGAVVYVDECRFSRQAPVPYAWQRRGQPPVALPAVRDNGE